eukprot:3934686-Rhodomonas_salina.1
MLLQEGSFFWEIVDLPSMVRMTGDTTGDVCNHARSKFIEAVSKVTLQEFMQVFNKIAADVHKLDDSFYADRGVKIHSLEVTSYRCAGTGACTRICYARATRCPVPTSTSGCYARVLGAERGVRG